ncbi:hypothetical protein FOZ60_006994 [Perkinsus olseni]|uniref:Uncharacterized protein n=1 Tax=Perkinsus olseni TaxID=32597 RepID=A0A7J6NMY1_PEROL|nr:hypothetical protein FOZ60_006994 [Perkinsus olseni]
MRSPGGSRGSQEPEEDPPAPLEAPALARSPAGDEIRPRGPHATPAAKAAPPPPKVAPKADRVAGTADPHRPKAQLPVSAYSSTGLASILMAQSQKIDLLTAKLDEHLAKDSLHQRELDFRRRIGSIGPFKLDDGGLRVRCTVRVVRLERVVDPALKEHLEIGTHTRSVAIAESGVASTKRKGHSYRSFERLLALQVENGVSFGDKNHSRTHFLLAFVRGSESELWLQR